MELCKKCEFREDDKRNRRYWCHAKKKPITLEKEDEKQEECDDFLEWSPI
jgi:hypothetical protein